MLDYVVGPDAYDGPSRDDLVSVSHYSGHVHEHGCSIHSARLNSLIFTNCVPERSLVSRVALAQIIDPPRCQIHRVLPVKSLMWLQSRHSTIVHPVADAQSMCHFSQSKAARRRFFFCCRSWPWKLSKVRMMFVYSRQLVLPVLVCTCSADHDCKDVTLHFIVNFIIVS